jgi:hypothetical protein
MGRVVCNEDEEDQKRAGRGADGLVGVRERRHGGTERAGVAESGPDYQYPSSGGTWEYGFWNAKVRSYYILTKTVPGPAARRPGTVVC